MLINQNFDEKISKLTESINKLQDLSKATSTTAQGQVPPSTTTQKTLEYSDELHGCVQYCKKIVQSWIPSFHSGPSSLINCPKAEKMRKHELLLHYYKKNLFRVAVPTRQQYISQPNARNCYGTNTICHSSGLLIIPNNCIEVNAINPHVLSTSFRNETDRYRSWSSITAQFITEVSDRATEQMRNSNDTHYTECQAQALLTTLFSLVAEQYLEALTTPTGHKKADITTDDVLIQIPR